MNNTTTRQDAIKAAASTILQHLSLIPGAKLWGIDRLNEIVEEPQGESFQDSISIEWERAWAVGADLMIHFRRSDDETLKDGTQLKNYIPRVEISWSGTGRSVAAARASAALYAQVVDLAALIEVQMTSLKIAEVR